MAKDFLMFEVPKNWNGDESFLTTKGHTKKGFKQIFWQLATDEKDVLASRVNKERFSFGGDGLDNAQKATNGQFLSVWHEAEENHIYPQKLKRTFEKMLDNLQPTDRYTEIKLRCFIRNVLDAISKFKMRVILVSW